MPWWLWLVVWASLAIVLLAMLALFVLSLFRKSVAVAAELERLARLAGVLDTADSILNDQRADFAVLADYAEVRRRRERVREEAAARRLARHDIRITRARALIDVDAAKRSWFVTPVRQKRIN